MPHNLRKICGFEELAMSRRQVLPEPEENILPLCVTAATTTSRAAKRLNRCKRVETKHQQRSTSKQKQLQTATDDKGVA